MSKLFVVTVDLVSPTPYYEVSTETTTVLVGVFSTREKAGEAARAAEEKHTAYPETYRVDDDDFDWWLLNDDTIEATARITETELDPEPEAAPEDDSPEPTAHYGNRSKRFFKRERRAA